MAQLLEYLKIFYHDLHVGVSKCDIEENFEHKLKEIENSRSNYG